MLKLLFPSKGGESKKEEFIRSEKILDSIKRDPSLDDLKKLDFNVYSLIETIRQNILTKWVESNSHPVAYVLDYDKKLTQRTNETLWDILNEVSEILMIDSARGFPREVFINPNIYKK